MLLVTYVVIQRQAQQSSYLAHVIWAMPLWLPTTSTRASNLFVCDLTNFSHAHTHWMTVVIYFGPINIRRFGNQFKYQSPSHLFSGPSSSTVEQPPQMRTPTSVGAHNQASVGPRGSPCASRWRPLLRRLCCPSSLGGLGYHARLRVAPSSMRVPESERLVGRRLERKS